MARRGRDLPSPTKAKEMLANPPHGGKGASPKQHRFFEMIAHGGKPTRVKGKTKK